MGNRQSNTRRKSRGASSSRGKGREAPKKTATKILSVLFSLLYYIVVVSIIVGSILFVANKDSQSSFFGYRVYNVLTDSMVPQKNSPDGGFYSGDVVIVKQADFSQVKESDVVTFAVGEESYLTHRLVEKLTELNGEEGEFLVTKGDANKSQDPPVDGSRLFGKVVFVIPYVGGVLNFLRGHFVVSLVFVISLFGFIWVIRFYLTTPLEEPKRKKRKR